MALKFEEREWTDAELNAGAGRVAARLLARGLEHGDRVAAYGLNSDAYLLLYVDTNLYWLSGRADTERGWGLRDETFRFMDTLRDLGGDPLFALGDADLATHLSRTAWLREGVGLAEVTARLARAMGVEPPVLPMCEQEVFTEVRVPEHGWIGYQDFLVRRGAADEVLEVRWAGVSSPGPGVLEAVVAPRLVHLDEGVAERLVADLVAVSGAAA